MAQHSDADGYAIVLATLIDLHAAGSPIARADGPPDLARAALRRWRSFERRSPRHRNEIARRVEDLAKGMRDAQEHDRGLVGPLMTDYRHAASAIADALA